MTLEEAERRIKELEREVEQLKAQVKVQIVPITFYAMPFIPQPCVWCGGYNCLENHIICNGVLQQ